MATEKAEEVIIAKRTPNNAMKLSEFAAKIELKTNTKNLEEVNHEIEKFDMIINST